ncbi:MAG: OmpA family protein [Opitutaceae bacterium]|nr:OmpA family protein [Opitutaceae bacterium]
MKKALFALVFLAVVGFGVWRWWDRLDPNAGQGAPAATSSSAAVSSAQSGGGATVEGLIEPETEVRALAAPVLYQMKDGVFDLELSEYAGYAGLIVANGGLAPSEESYFFKNHGFKVRITISEEESWDALNSGRIGGSATTVDVLAVYAKTFQAVVPAQIGFSRGSDAIVVLNDIKRVNQLAGRTVVASQFTEADFFIRYLASEAGLEVKALDVGEAPDPEKINLVYAEDSFEGGDLFARLINEGRTDIAGAVLWGSKIQEVLESTQGKTRVLVDNRNLLVVADVLVVNKPFAQANPKVVEGLVDGLLAGNDMVRTNPDAHLDVVARAFKWESRAQTKVELAQIHFSNLPENKAFFSGAIDAAGSYAGIFTSAMFAYGPILNHSVPPERQLDLKLDAPFAAKYAAQTVSIQPIRSTGTRSIEQNPLLTRDIRFFFEPNSAVLQATPDNDKNYASIKQLLQVAPGSTILLRGHVDNTMVPEFRKQGGESLVRSMALKAMELSRQRAESVRVELKKRYQLPDARMEVIGRGWEEPAGNDGEKNRRVEVQWFTVE